MQEFILKNLITIIFVILLVYGFIRGFSQGFLKKILSFGALIVTIIVTKIFTPIVAEAVKDFTNVEATLSDMIYDVFINSSAYDKIDINGLSKIFNTGDIGSTIKNTLCINIANALINLVCGIGVFIFVLIVIRIVLAILDVVDYIPVVGQFNKILGGVLGVFEIIVFAWVVFTVLRILENVPQVSVIVENIKHSKLLWVLYDNNIIFNFFSNMFSIFKPKEISNK